MSDKVYYHGGENEVRLGDLVETRVLLFWKTRGRIAYVPGISPPHPEMAFNGLTYVGIRSADCGMIGVTVIPETNTIKKGIRFIARDPDGNFEPMRPDERRFDDE
jgi:hypothetical protein